MGWMVQRADCSLFKPLRVAMCLLGAGALAACPVTDLVEAIDADVVPRKPILTLTTDSTVTVDQGDLYQFTGTIRADGDGGVGATDYVEFEITNEGNAQLTVQVADLTGTDPTHFDVDTSSLLGTVDAAGGSTTRTSFKIRFDPLTPGDKTAAVTILTNDPARRELQFAIAGSAEWWGFQDLTVVGDVSAYTTFGSLAVHDNEVLVVYTQPDTDPQATEVRLLKSSDGGGTWESPVTVVQGAETGWRPRETDLWADGTDLYLTYRYYYDETASEPWFTHSDDGGLTWEAAQELPGTGFVKGLYPAVCATDEAVLVAHYVDGVASNYGELVRSSDGGTTWNYEAFPDTSNDFGAWNQWAAAGGALYLTYYDYENENVVVRKSWDHGQTWTTYDVDPGQNVGRFPSIAARESSVWVAYQDLTDPADRILKLAVSDNQGVSWNRVVVDETGDTGYSSAVSALAASTTDDVILLAYSQQTDELGEDTKDLVLARSLDGGTTWNSGAIDSAGDTGWFVSTAVDEVTGYYYVLYYTRTDPGTLRLAKSVDGGASF